mgnify:CR=1 FL=1
MSDGEPVSESALERATANLLRDHGIGGFQRAELEVPIDFTQAGLSADPATMDSPQALQSL